MHRRDSLLLVVVVFSSEDLFLGNDGEGLLLVDLDGEFLGSLLDFLHELLGQGVGRGDISRAKNKFFDGRKFLGERIQADHQLDSFFDGGDQMINKL